MDTHPFSAFMTAAVEQARLAGEAAEVPVGAVIVRGGAIIARGQNRTLRDADPSAHAEVVAMRAAAQALANHRLTDCDLWVTLEPCAMCAGAIAHARIARLYYGADDAKGGAVMHGARLFDHPQTLHRPEIYSGIGAGDSALLLKDFFRARRS